jgi:hypothetical protein
MNFKIFGIGIVLMSLLAGFSSPSEAREPPVAKLVQVTGSVEYSRNGTSWRPVKRTKYLFSGYQIKTGEDGGGRLINQSTGMAQDLGANSEISVMDMEVALISGSLSEPVEESSTIFHGLSNKFAKAQRYTTVRRSVTKTDDQACDSKVRTIKKVSLSSAHPDLVWRNACPEYSYRLVIDGDQVHEIAAASNAEMMRFAVEGASEGEHTYRVEVLDIDGTVYIPKKDSKFTWISDDSEAKILADVDKINDDAFLVTNMLETNGMYVAAMDVYRDYFNENPDDNDMRPLLIQSYQGLKLSNLRENEARLYNASLEEDF